MGLKKVVLYRFPDGTEMDLFYIGTLADELGRASDTVRKWEIAGVIPETCFKDKNGARLYSREQIDAIVEAAEKAHISQGRPIRNSTFTKRVTESMEKLRMKYAEMQRKGNTDVEKFEEESKA